MATLEEIRHSINEIDSQLLTLFAKRRAISIEVAKNKIVMNKAVRDPRREQELLAYLTQVGAPLGLSSSFIQRIFQLIIEDSVLTQQDYIQQQSNTIAETDLSVAYLGPLGSYSSLAARKFLSREVDPVREVGCSSFSQVFKEVESGNCRYGVLPIENLTSGSINDVYDLMQQTSLSIVAELTYPIDHCLLSAVETTLENIQTVYGHPQPLTQSSEFFELHSHITKQVCESSSASMLKVKELADPKIAAIGSAEGGELYGLYKLASGLANQKDNCTRFWVVARSSIQVSELVPAKTTFIMSTTQRTGSLVEALLVLKNHNINMTKLESRPIPGNPWEEMFYVDVAENIESEAMQDTLKSLAACTRQLKVLGCYPSEDVHHSHSPTAE